MAKPKRKLVSMIVTVSVPADRLAGDARSQVRDILTSETTWDAHMKVRKVQPAGPTSSQRKPQRHGAAGRQ